MPEPADRDAAFETAIDRAARDLADEARRAVTEHPEAEELVAYQEGRLAEDRTEHVRRHLVACPDCARELLQLKAFDLDQPADPALMPSREETAEDWATFQRRVVEEEAGAPVFEITGRTRPSATPPANAWLSRGRWLLAASILIAVTGLAFWLAGLAQRAEPPSSMPPLASLNPFGFDLLPDGEGIVRDAAGAREVEVPPGMDLLVPRLKLGDQTPYSSYRADIFDAAGNAVWSQSDLQRQPAGQFMVLVPRSSLPGESYQLKLGGITGGEQTVLATYSFHLRYARD